jgi:hypothetical protein
VFDGLDASIKALVDTLLDSSAKVELKIEHRAAITDATIESNVQLARQSIVDAVGDASKAQEQEIQLVEAQLTVIQASGDQNLTATQDSRDEVIANIAFSTAISSDEHEQTKVELTQHWKSTEEQISQLREEIRQLKTMLAESIQRVVSSGVKPQHKKQKQMNEDTNLLYKVLVAKDLMLQKLLVSLTDHFQFTNEVMLIYRE